MEDMAIPSSPWTVALRAARGTHRGIAGSHPSAPLRGERRGKGAQETHLVLKTFRATPAGSVSALCRQAP